MLSEKALTDNILCAIQSVLTDARKPVSLHEPEFCGNEWAYVRECIDSTFVSSVGKYVDRFESMLCDYTGVGKAIAVVNGTAALHAALILAEVKSGHEVFVPAMTFVGTANAVSYTGATPHFVDCDEITLGIDPVKLELHLSRIGKKNNGHCLNRETGRIIRAVVPMHTFGHPVDLDAICDLCRHYAITVIEDAAEAIGSLYKGRHVGNWGHLSILSFNGNKLVTTGGGGAILTNDSKLGEAAKHLTTTAKLPHRWAYTHDRVGYNYRMPNINAALGCAQIERLPEAIEKKRRLAARYKASFKDVEGLGFFSEAAFAQSNYWLNAVLLDPALAKCRDTLLDAAHQNGFLTRPAWTLMNRLPMFENCPKMDLSGAESIEARLVNLPSSSFL